MREIKECWVVAGINPVELQENKHIKDEGWQPFWGFTIYYSSSTRHCEERSDEAIQLELLPAWIATLHKKHSARKDG